MKQKLLMGVFGLGLMLSFVTVKAETIDNVEEDTNYTSADVTVWNVETPIYDVEIIWHDLSFDWIYDSNTKNYKWQQNLCSKVPEYVKENLTKEMFDVIYSKELYTSRDCLWQDNVESKEITYEEVVANIDNYYYQSIASGENIVINDKSKNVSITPSVEWNSTENYDWTIGEFYTFVDECHELSEEEFNNLTNKVGIVFTDLNCSNTVLDEDISWNDDKYYHVVYTERVVTTKELPDSLRYNDHYGLFINLKVDETKEIITPKIGDTIGTITVSIK